LLLDVSWGGYPSPPYFVKYSFQKSYAWSYLQNIADKGVTGKIFILNGLWRRLKEKPRRVV
jgi:hypothetical protein